MERIPKRIPFPVSPNRKTVNPAKSSPRRARHVQARVTQAAHALNRSKALNKIFPPHPNCREVSHCWSIWASTLCSPLNPPPTTSTSPNWKAASVRPRRPSAQKYAGRSSSETTTRIKMSRCSHRCFRMTISTIFTLKRHLRGAAKLYTDIHTILSLMLIIWGVSFWGRSEMSRGHWREDLGRMKWMAFAAA